MSIQQHQMGAMLPIALVNTILGQDQTVLAQLRRSAMIEVTTLESTAH